MTKEEQWKREVEIKLDELDDRGFDFDNWSISDAYERGYCDCAEPRENLIAELEEKISVLLSCKNCSENKGGYICEKEYENKCLAQKMQYIKELQEENAELDCQKNRNKFCYSCENATERCFRNEIGCPCEKYKSWKEENAELKEALEGYKKIAKWCDDCKKIKELEEKNHAMLVNSLKICNQSEIDNDEIERKIAELEAQIEELKCCANCKYEEQGYMVEPCKSCNRYFPTLKVGARDKWERR